MPSSGKHKERLVRVEEKILASEKALELARGTLSRNSLISVITVIISVITLVLYFIKK